MDKKYEFTDSTFMSAKGKHLVLRQWEAFLKDPCWLRFTKALYEHLIQHCNFIAHYNRRGFFEVYFGEPSMTLKFWGQFDRGTGCCSVEYGSSDWLNASDYRDINQAMVAAAEPHLGRLRKQAADDEVERAKQSLQHAQNRLALAQQAVQRQNDSSR